MIKVPNISAFNKTSEAGLDVFAYSIFLNGCNFRCPYCMNSRLVNNCIDKFIPIEKIRNAVNENEIELVMISGGEPTCTDVSMLNSLIDEMRFWGCKVGLSTNGSKPNVLSKIIDKLSFVAMDIKSPNFFDYCDISGPEITDMVYKSKQLLWSEKSKRLGQFNYEIRTTLYPPFFKDVVRDIYCIGLWMEKSDRWVFQQFRSSKNMLNVCANNVIPFNDDKIETILKEARKYCDDVSIRYV